MTYYPQDSKKNDTVTFGNKIFDSAHNWAMQQKAKNANEHIGNSVKQLTQNVTSMMNNGVWYIWS
jgi:transposase